MRFSSSPSPKTSSAAGNIKELKAVPSRTLEIARDESILGKFSEGEIQELLQSGFLQPSDLFREDESCAWATLGSLASSAARPSKTRSVLEQAVPVAKTVLASTANAARAMKTFAT